MSYWLHWAVKRPIKRNYTNRRRARTDGIILHVDAMAAKTLYGFFNSPGASASSHLFVKFDGTVEQYVDLDLISWASARGDARCISVETQGKGAGKWTAAQVNSLARIIRETSQHYGYPLRLMTSSKGQKGVGWHKLGVPASTFQKNRGVSQTGGELWSKAVGKICPGPERIPQIPGIVERAKTGVKHVAPPPRVDKKEAEKKLAALAEEAGAVLVEREKNKMKLMGIYWDDSAAKKPVYALWHPVSGFFVKHSGVDGEYNNQIAKALETGSWAKVSEKHAEVIERACSAVRG